MNILDKCRIINEVILFRVGSSEFLKSKGRILGYPSYDSKSYTGKLSRMFMD